MLGIGLMSGTSADGIDAVVARITPGTPPALEQLGFVTHPYPTAIRKRLFRCFNNEATVSELCALNVLVGECFADAAEAALRASGIPREELDFIASHGQTVWHQPEPMGEPPARGTLQIGEAARIAERLRVPVVSDFRQQDMAAGGQGAPLIPYFDYLLFSHPTLNRAAQNIGGIGNVTYLRASGAPGEVLAFDTGPGNAWMDAAAALVTGGAQSCDLDGRLAAGAPVDAALLARLLTEPYLHQPPPKSTGRELFSAARVRELWDAGHTGPALVSTLTQFTVESIVRAYRQWLGPVDEVLIGGGGARNPELLRRLAAAVRPARVLTTQNLHIDSDAKEALGFAILGWETLRGNPSNVPSATGALRPVPQGKICLP